MPGQETYNELTIETYKSKSKKFLRESSKKYFVNRKFGIGEEVDRKKLRHYQMLSKILNSEETQLIDWVVKKINTVPDGGYCDMDYNRHITDGCGEINDCSINKCCTWNKVEW